MATVRRTRALAALGATGLALGLALTGCGSSDGGTSSTGAPAAAPAQRNDLAEDAAGGAAPGAGQDSAAGESGQTAPAQPGSGGGAPIITREVIYTGSITVRVDEVDLKAEEVIRLAESVGGFVGSDARSSDVNVENSQYARATVVLRVPRESFYATLDRVAGLGKEEARKVDAQDVTEEVVDLESRITSQRAQVDSARRLLEKATSIQDLVSLENELAKRQADLAALEAKRDRLKDLASLSTLTVELIQESAPPVVPDEPRTGFLGGLEAGWNAFLAFGRILLAVVGALLPWIVGLGVPLFAVFVLVRRLRRRNTAVAPAPVSAPAPAAPPASAP